MRISGWSSDVCSSDLKLVAERIGFGFFSVAHVEHELTKAQAGNRLERQRVILLDGRHVAGVCTFKDVYAAGPQVRQTYRGIGYGKESDLVEREDLGVVVFIELLQGYAIEIGRASWRKRVRPYV